MEFPDIMSNDPINVIVSASWSAEAQYFADIISEIDIKTQVDLPRNYTEATHLITEKSYFMGILSLNQEVKGLGDNIYGLYLAEQIKKNNAHAIVIGTCSLPEDQCRKALGDFDCRTFWEREGYEFISTANSEDHIKHYKRLNELLEQIRR